MLSDGDLYQLALSDSALSDSRSAVEELVARYSAPMIAYVRASTSQPAVAEDAVADAWLRFFRHIKAARSGTGKPLNKPDSIRYWLFRTAINSMRDYFRQSSRRTDLQHRVESETVARGLLTQEPVDTTAMENAERLQAVAAAFAELDDGCREFLALLLVDPPLSYKEISILLDRPIGSIGPTRQRCLDRLRERIAEQS